MKHSVTRSLRGVLALVLTDHLVRLRQLGSRGWRQRGVLEWRKRAAMDAARPMLGDGGHVLGHWVTYVRSVSMRVNSGSVARDTSLLAN